MTIDLYTQNPALEACKTDIEAAKDLMIETYRTGNKLLLCGNGGSCADCDHIVGELLKGFLLRREPSEELKNKIRSLRLEGSDHLAENLQMGLPAVSLHSQAGLLSAFCNDVAADTVYAQTLLGLGKPGDLLIALSTSGNSKNVVYAAMMAKALGIRIISMTGAKESKLSAISDVTIRVPSTDTYRVQEYHLPVYHYLCAEVEAAFFEK
ncbi:MAG: SIS domain-containing protein [Clostridia bacterium]|nr:SIS domain-containing protein [Clostridia bacterium]